MRCSRRSPTVGHVTQPLEATFWAAAFGTLVDRFGIPRAINCEQSR
jgi:PhnB protein